MYSTAFFLFFFFKPSRSTKLHLGCSVRPQYLHGDFPLHPLTVWLVHIIDAHCSWSLDLLTHFKSQMKGRTLWETLFFLGHKYYSNSNWRPSVLTTACPLQISVKTKWVCIDFHWTNALTVGWTQPKSSLGITHTHIYIHTLPPDEEKHKWAKRC